MQYQPFPLPVACVIKFTASYLRCRADQRRSLWRASIVIYLALSDGVKYDVVNFILQATGHCPELESNQVPLQK